MALRPERTENARKAREQARRALGRPADPDDEYKGLPPRRSAPLVQPQIRWEPTGESIPVLTFADVARELGVPQSRVAAMVDAGELATLKVGDWGARFVARAEVKRIKAARDV